MSASNPPRQIVNGKLNELFNINNWRSSGGYVTFDDLMSYANVFNSNIFYAVNTFTEIDVTNLSVGFINGINTSIFSIIQQTLINVSKIFYDSEHDIKHCKER